MHLDMSMISTVSGTVTAILGVVLLLTWGREWDSSFVGWWGFALLIQSLGIFTAAVASSMNDADLVTASTATMIVADALKWKAARRFENRYFHPLLLIAGPVLFLAIAHSGLVSSFDGRLILMSMFLSAYNLACAAELADDGDERLSSRKSAVVLLIVAAVSQLSWLPLILTMPIGEAALVYASSWFLAITLITLLLRVALAFVVLALAKERQEHKQRVGALTDPLTGLPNRRALFEAADALAIEERKLKGHPVSVLIFDLDRFKQINDSFGHAVGDRVLKLFAATLTEQLDKGSIVARIGGEEFVVILPQTDPAGAVQAAESVRTAFAASAAVVDEIQVGGTVSAGGASNVSIDCDLGAPFRRADAALYAAKHAGRNRVEFVGPDEVIGVEPGQARIRPSRSEKKESATVSDAA